MRPVVKFKSGIYKNEDDSILEIYDDYPNYKDSKNALVYNLDMYCSYCECAFHYISDLHVEHVQPINYIENGVKPYKQLETKWSNFLLSCSTCNGRANKGCKNVIFSECHLPHINNTFISLVYKSGGLVEVNPKLTGDSYEHAKNLLELVGLDKTPINSTPGDTRWRKRKNDWDLACKYRNKYDSKKITEEFIIDIIKQRGGWSIWFTVFKGCDDIRKLLIERFDGTAKDCFDPENNYEPINRNPHNVKDPV